MHDCRSSEVVEVNRVEISQPSVRAPCPVTDDRVDEAGDADAVEQVADEIAATDHRARSNRRAGIRECILEYPVRKQRNTRGAVGRSEPMQHESGGANPRRPRTEHEGEAPQPEGDAADARVGDSFHQNVYSFTR